MKTSTIERILTREKSTIRYLIITSCIKKFIPRLKEVEFDNFYRKVLSTQMKAWKEQYCRETIRNTPILNKWNLLDKPVIYCSFHYSSYRLSILILARLQKHIALVVSEDVLQEQGLEMQALYNSICTFPLVLINANAANSLHSIREQLKNGYSIFVYVDGNNGTDGMKNNGKNLLRISLLESSIMVRKGIAYISFITKTPITPLMIDEIDGRKQLEIYPSIIPPERKEYSDYVHTSTRELYNLLNAKLEKDPTKWEPWLYIHKFFLPTLRMKESTSCIDYSALKFNTERYCLYNHKNGNSYYVFDKENICAYQIEESTYDKLSKGKSLQCLSRDIISSLYEIQAII